MNNPAYGDGGASADLLLVYCVGMMAAFMALLSVAVSVTAAGRIPGADTLAIGAAVAALVLWEVTLVLWLWARRTR